MMKIYVNREPIRGPWGGGNHWVGAIRKAIHISQHELLSLKDHNARPDVILLAGLTNDGKGISAEQAISYKMYLNESAKLILRVNENDARKGTTGIDQMLKKVASHMDGTVFVSNWIKEYFEEKEWPCKKTTVIYNGVDGEIYKSNKKIDNNKINIVTHHWSDNFLKGFDIYDKIDEFVGQHPTKFSFTYIGRHRNTFKNTTLIRPLYGKALGEELGKYDVYVSGSRFDPGPNHITESISCGLPTYVHKEGGGSVEFAGKDHVYENWEELRMLLLNENFKQNKTSFSNWDSCSQQYINFLEEITL